MDRAGWVVLVVVVLFFLASMTMAIVSWARVG